MEKVCGGMEKRCRLAYFVSTHTHAQDWVGAGRAGWVGGVGRVEVGRVGCWRAGWEGCGTHVHTARKGVCMAE